MVKQRGWTDLCPGHFSDIEKLVIAASHDAVSDGEEAASVGRKRRRNVVVFELVHFPTAHRNAGICWCGIDG